MGLAGAAAPGTPSPPRPHRHAVSFPQPFQKHVYYPLASGGPEGPDAPAAASGARPAMASGPYSAASGPLPFFQFRPRLESVDWRRLSAIDVDKVAGAVDVLTLQENIMNITFCKLEDEKCPHCQSGVDPVLLKLIRLAQLTIEYLLHSQEFLTSQLRGLEERLRLSVAESEQSQKLLAKQAGEMKLLKEECKRRKKMISTQQLMIEAKASYYQVGPRVAIPILNLVKKNPGPHWRGYGEPFPRSLPAPLFSPRVKQNSNCNQQGTWFITFRRRPRD